MTPQEKEKIQQLIAQSRIRAAAKLSAIKELREVVANPEVPQSNPAREAFRQSLRKSIEAIKEGVNGETSKEQVVVSNELQRSIEKPKEQQDSKIVVSEVVSSLDLETWEAEGGATQQEEGYFKIITPPQERTQITSRTNIHGSTITLNEKQSEAVTRVLRGESICLIGPAGTGKTTAVEEMILQLIKHCKIPVLKESTKKLRAGALGAVAVAFTRRAVGNVRKQLPQELKANAITIHALCEYEPVIYSITDQQGQAKNTMRFEPQRTAGNPLPSDIQIVFIDETSMVSVELYEVLRQALYHGSHVQFIFIGDIQQLPPVFGSAILGYKLLELPVVELTEVYRQALESPIIRLAHRILSGKQILPAEIDRDWQFPGHLEIRRWKTKMKVDKAVNLAGAWLGALIEQGKYEPTSDMVLVPFNKAFGSIELNRMVCAYLDKKRPENPIYEVIAGFERHFLAVGDRILVNKEDAIITKIAKNGQYWGKPPRPASPLLTRWGMYQSSEAQLEAEATDSATDEFDIDAALDSMGSADELDEERTQEASHVITYKILETEEEDSISSAGGINSIIGGYVTTIHKAQGSQAKRVILLLHNSHATMLNRELLYTAVTRAAEELIILCEQDSLAKGINTQSIKGNTLAEKAEFFKGKIEQKKLESRQLPGIDR